MGAQFGYRDENTGFLYMLGHRFYDAQFGQFMTRDPIGYRGGVNLYRRVRTNPLNTGNYDLKWLYCINARLTLKLRL